MPPKLKPNAKMSRGAVTAPTKQSNRAAKRAQASAAPRQDLDATEEELSGDEGFTAISQGSLTAWTA